MLEERVFSVKKRFLAMYKKANAGHIGSSLSCAEILVFLKFAWMREDDVVVLSKGHAAAALYSVLAEAKLLTAEDIDSYYEEGTRLPALPPFFCVTSDGELDEGSTWEAALFIAHHRLTNLVWVIDRNQIQGIARTEDVLALEPLDANLRAFGFHVLCVDGHDFSALSSAREQCELILQTEPAPVAIIANTIKGNGLGHLQDTVDSHYLPMTDTQYARAVDELTRAHAAASKAPGDAG